MVMARIEPGARTREEVPPANGEDKGWHQFMCAGQPRPL